MIFDNVAYRLLEQTLCYITHVAHCIQDNADPNTAKFWRALLHKAYDVLDKVQLTTVSVVVSVYVIEENTITIPYPFGYAFSNQNI